MSVVYKFKPINKGTERRDAGRIIELLDGKLHLSDWDGLNDVWEGCYKFDDPACRSKLRDVFKSKKEYLVYSLSKSDSDQKHILRSHLMWAHYASNHAGVAVEFDLRKLPKGIDKLNVSYGEEPQHISRQDITNMDSDDGQRKDLIRRILAYKTNEWEYEQEVRLMVEKSNPRVFTLDHGKGDCQRWLSLDCNVSRVVLGCRFELHDENLKKLLTDSCRDRGIPCEHIVDMKEYQNDFVSPKELEFFRGRE